MEDPVYLDDEQVLRRMLSSELKQTLPQTATATANNQFQKDFQPDDRRELLKWMRDVCQAEECQADVFPLSVTIVDRFLSFVKTKRTQLQLLGAVALLLSSKLRQTQQIPARHLIYYTQDLITLKELKTWELLVLTTLKWDLALVTPVDFLDILIKRTKITDEHMLQDIEEEAQRMIADCCLDHKYNLYPPSVIASACLSKATDRALQLEAEATIMQQQQQHQHQHQQPSTQVPMAYHHYDYDDQVAAATALLYSHTTQLPLHDTDLSPPMPHHSSSEYFVVQCFDDTLVEAVAPVPAQAQVPVPLQQATIIKTMQTTTTTMTATND